MTRTQLMLFALFTLAVSPSAFANDNATRLYLDDPDQESHTTSINWPDLPASRKKVALPAKRSIRVVLDPGHGGKDAGAVGWFGLKEKEYCLKVAELVKRELEREANRTGLLLEVLLTRESDDTLALRDRVRMSNDWVADAFVSLHLNSSPSPKARGFEVYFMSPEATDAEAAKLARVENGDRISKPLANPILSMISDAQSSQHVSRSSAFAETLFQAISRKVRSNGRGVRQAPFTVLAGTTMPSVLVEIGYLSNSEEARNLATFSYLKRLAGAISSGIIEFVTQKKRLS